MLPMSVHHRCAPVCAGCKSPRARCRARGSRVQVLRDRRLLDHLQQRAIAGLSGGHGRSAGGRRLVAHRLHDLRAEEVTIRAAVPLPPCCSVSIHVRTRKCKGQGHKVSAACTLTGVCALLILRLLRILEADTVRRTIATCEAKLGVWWSAGAP